MHAVAAAFIASYVMAVVAASSAVAFAIADGDAATRLATIIGPAVVAATLRQVSRSIRRAVGADRDAMHALVEVADALARITIVEDAVSASVEVVRRKTKAGAVRIVRPSPGVGSGEEVVAESGSALTSSGALVRVPVRSHGTTIAFLEIDIEAEVTPPDPAVVAALADQLAPAVRNTMIRRELAERIDERRRTSAELAAARRRLVELGDRERRGLERDLHDGAQQGLMALVLRLGLAARVATRATPSEAQLLELARVARDQLVAASTGLVPDDLAARGVAAALDAVARRGTTGATVEVVADDVPDDLPTVVARAVYFTCVEALQNAAKHAGADCVRVVVAGDAEGVQFEITDDGCGIPSGAVDGFGLRSMRERVAALGGWLTVTSGSDRGTSVAGWLPLRETVSA